jgi:hypothetical protein
LVAKYADGWNYGLCSYTKYIESCLYWKTIDNGYYYNDITKAWHGILFLASSEDKLKSRKEMILDKKEYGKNM